MKQASIISFALITVLVFSFQNFGSNLLVGERINKLPVKQVQRNLSINLELSSQEIDHSTWDILLKKHVDENGYVDYKEFLNDHSKLSSYLQYLTSNIPNNDWSVQELLAYYINLYNAQTIALILENYPLESIKNISRPWSRSLIEIGEEKYSLGDIEHDILRKMNEPRIHFAINCASYSCPNLLNEAFTASKIDEQLEKVSFSFINGNKNDISSDNPKLSRIFKWYKNDFVFEGEEDLIVFINQYSTIKIEMKADIDYKDYNWDLNEIL